MGGKDQLTEFLDAADRTRAKPFQVWVEANWRILKVPLNKIAVGASVCLSLFLIAMFQPSNSPVSLLSAVGEHMYTCFVGRDIDLVCISCLYIKGNSEVEQISPCPDFVF